MHVLSDQRFEESQVAAALFNNDAINDLINDLISDLINDPINQLKDPERALLTLIMTGQARNKQEFSEKIGKSPATVQRYIKHLTELGIIRREGSNKNGRWIIVK